MRNASTYQAVAEELKRTHGDGFTCEEWRKKIRGLIDSGIFTPWTVNTWPCPSCKRKGCDGEKVTLPIPFALLPTRWIQAT